MEIEKRTKAGMWLSLLWVGALLGLASAQAAPPVLRFPNGISWKAVFDAGFRPKHVPGLEKDTTECRNQPVRFELEGISEPFILDPGRFSIELRPDDSVRLFMHTSHVPISMEEGERRLMAFRRIFEKHLIRKGWMPSVMDERGSVMTSSEQFAVGKIGVHVFTFGFTASSRRDLPLIARFQLAWVGTGNERTSNIRRKIVVPPAGYEWYSMDPKVHTPDPGGPSNAAAEAGGPPSDSLPAQEPRPRVAKSPAYRSKREEWDGPRPLGVPILITLLGLGFLFWKWQSRRVRGRLSGSSLGVKREMEASGKRGKAEERG